MARVGWRVVTVLAVAVLAVMPVFVAWQLAECWDRSMARVLEAGFLAVAVGVDVWVVKVCSTGSGTDGRSV